MTHIFSQFNSSNPDVIRCNALAAESWKRLGWVEVPIGDHEVPRLFDGDGKKVPFIKDVIDRGVGPLTDDEIVVFTNTDIQVRSDAVFHIACRLNSTDAGYCFRRDFPPRIGLLPDSDYIRGHPYSGSDLYAFRVGWWRKHRNSMPDMLVAYEATDPVLRHLIHETNLGAHCNFGDLIAHEKNGNSWWEKPENRYSLKGQLHNLALASAFFARRWIPASRFGIPANFLTRGRRR